VLSLACCSPQFSFDLIVFCGFIHSIFAFSGFGRFRLVDLSSLVLLSLSTRGMFSYLCMLGMLSGCIIDFGFQKFLDGKTSNGHNF